MIYLLAKYTLLFALTALLGIALGYWLARRKFEDVTESFEDQRAANKSSEAAQWDRLWIHLNAMPVSKETDLSGVYERIDKVSNAVARLPKPQPVNLRGIEARMDDLLARVNAIPVPLMSRESHREARKETRILKAALYGAKDNLQSISGVGPKLERLLNQPGAAHMPSE